MGSTMQKNIKVGDIVFVAFTNDGGWHDCKILHIPQNIGDWFHLEYMGKIHWLNPMASDVAFIRKD